MNALAVITSFKCSRAIISKYFGFSFFKAKLTNTKLLFPFNVLSLLSVFLCSISVIVATVIILYDDKHKGQIFVSALDALIVTIFMVIMIIWEAQKNERYFQDNEGHFINFNQAMQRMLNPELESKLIEHTPQKGNERTKSKSALNQSAFEKSDVKLMQDSCIDEEK